MSAKIEISQMAMEVGNVILGNRKNKQQGAAKHRLNPLKCSRTNSLIMEWEYVIGVTLTYVYIHTDVEMMMVSETKGKMP